MKQKENLLYKFDYRKKMNNNTTKKKKTGFTFHKTKILKKKLKSIEF
jgi:hypothetical protein